MGAAECGSAMCRACGAVAVPLGPRVASAGHGREGGQLQAKAASIGAIGVSHPACLAPREATSGSVGVGSLSSFAHRTAPAGFEKRSERLVQAARMGDFRKTVDAIADGCDIHCCAPRGLSPLMLAASASGEGAVPTLKFLIEVRAKLEARDDQGWTAVSHACRSGRAELVSLLWEHKASVTDCASDGKTALILAVMENADGLAQSLVGWQVAIDGRDMLGWSPLLYACCGGNAIIVSWLLRAYASAATTAVDGMTSLMIAARAGSPKIVKRLLRERVDVNAQQNGSCCSALMFALEAHEESIAEFLFENKADILAPNADEDDAIDIAESMGLLALKQKMTMAAVEIHEMSQKVKDAKPKASGHAASRRKGISKAPAF